MTLKGPLAILDVAYGAEAAAAACLVAETWTSSTASMHVTECADGAAADYEPGSFFRRELPLILRVLDWLPETPGVLIIDGYVWLGGPEQPGLGARLFEAMGGAVPVVGVAKTAYRGDDWSERVFRHASRRPLYVTSAGVAAALAARAVGQMHGAHRIPTLLGQADRLARDALKAWGGRR